MIYRLHPDLPELFPDPDNADPSGIVAVGGDLSPARLAAAYSAGIFPWYDADSPILWWSPDPRCLLLPETFHVPRSLRRRLNKPDQFRLTLDRAFERVIRACAASPRPGQRGTWITGEMIAAFRRLHHLGLAHSAEAWADGELVGGIYGVALGRAFFGESMFHSRPYASKVVLVTLARTLWESGFRFLDCQMPTPHVLGYGARMLPRRSFLHLLAEAVASPHPFPRELVATGFWGSAPPPPAGGIIPSVGTG